MPVFYAFGDLIKAFNDMMIKISCMNVRMYVCICTVHISNTYENKHFEETKIATPSRPIMIILANCIQALYECMRTDEIFFKWFSGLKCSFSLGKIYYLSKCTFGLKMIPLPVYLLYAFVSSPLEQ